MTNNFYSDWVELYDLMVDWPRRLSREGPALLKLLGGSAHVLDVACGTGRHLARLAQAGLNVAGADSSAEMLEYARRQLPADRHIPLIAWSMEQPVPAELAARAPFDALLCLGNSFPHVVTPEQVADTLANFRSLLRPGGRLVLGLKALALLRDAKLPFLPLVKRSSDGRDVFFVRFYDFAIPAGPAPAVDFHLVIAGRDLPLLAPSGVHHAVTRLRAWSPGELGEEVQRGGFADVIVAADLAGRPWAAGDTEDVFVLARA
ncbi:MAG: class I SAM-dependent methyltransferase [Phycisphaerae bacterium]|nr:class I SAM-dependent methyltransferase [Phycisphaerae bacterium]